MNTAEAAYSRIFGLSLGAVFFAIMLLQALAQ